MEDKKSLLKNISFFASILGLYNALAFCVMQKIPFPLELTTLPSLALAVGLLSCLFIIITVVYSLISAFVIFDPLDIDYRKVFYCKPHAKIPEGCASFINFLLFFSMPHCIFMALNSLEYEFSEWILLTYWISMPFLFSYYALTPSTFLYKEKFATLRKGIYWRTSANFFGIGTLSIVSMIFFIKFLGLGFKIESKFELILSLGIFELLSYITVIPPSLEKTSTYPKLSLRPPTLFQKLKKMPAAYVYFVAITFALLPPAASNITTAALRILKIGNVEKIYYYSLQSKAVIPPELLDHCEGDFCVTKNMNVILDVGNILYVRAIYLGEDRPISLPRSSLNVIEPPSNIIQKPSIDN